MRIDMCALSMLGMRKFSNEQSSREISSAQLAAGHLQTALKALDPHT